MESQAREKSSKKKGKAAMGDEQFKKNRKTHDTEPQDSKASVTLPGTVERIIPPIDPREPEKAQIGVDGADQLYREIRVDNRLRDQKGEEVSLKPGSEVDVTIEADESAVRRKNSTAESSERGGGSQEKKHSKE